MCKFKSQENRFKSYAPGKVMISGEWAVLEQGHPCIATNVNVGLTVEIKQGSDYCIHSPSMGIDRFSDLKDFSCKDTLFLRTSIDVLNKYLKEKGIIEKKLSINIESDISSISGLGSSSAVTVAFFKAASKFYNLGLDDEKIFKISSIANYIAQSKIRKLL